jgi:hypothetical protein
VGLVQLECLVEQEEQALQDPLVLLATLAPLDHREILVQLDLKAKLVEQEQQV